MQPGVSRAEAVRASGPAAGDQLFFDPTIVT